MLLSAAVAGDAEAFRLLTAPHRRELLVHCYRMLGSLDDADDAVQETLLKAWRRLAGFEGRATLRAWLYRIATNVCLDALDHRDRRILPPAILSPADPHLWTLKTATAYEQCVRREETFDTLGGSKGRAACERSSTRDSLKITRGLNRSPPR